MLRKNALKAVNFLTANLREKIRQIKKIIKCISTEFKIRKFKKKSNSFLTLWKIIVIIINYLSKIKEYISYEFRQ